MCELLIQKPRAKTERHTFDTMQDLHRYIQEHKHNRWNYWIVPPNTVTMIEIIHAFNK